VTAALPPLLVIAGATATGKTGLAVRIAQALSAEGRHTEIISADSRQVYRGLDIGTAKVTGAERALVPHHGLDLVDPDEPFSVADFVDHAHDVLGRLVRTDGIALLVGGTGLYLRAVARGLDTTALPNDAAVRARLEAELATGGLAPLAERLDHIAPMLAAGVDHRNPRRVVRALEIAELRGDGILPPARGYPAPVVWIGLTVEPSEHARRIATRAQSQFEAGLVEEAVGLRERFDPGLPAFSAIGYREAWAVADGRQTRDSAIAQDAARNVAFAKRQRTWFRSEPDVVWIDTTTDDPLPAALDLTRAIAG